MRVSETAAAFARDGWLRFAAEPQLLDWVSAALPAAQAAAADPGNAHWLRCGGTWFVGVDVLPNDSQGRIGAGPPLGGAACSFIAAQYGTPSLSLHRAQVSVCYPGYPQASPQESEAALRFRRERDAAHVDGLLAEGPTRRRYLREPHAWILGVPLTATTAENAAPVVWTGSHHVMRAAFMSALGKHAPQQWGQIDLTGVYTAARHAVFANCPRVTLEMQPGEACLLHRHVLHGTAPWNGPSNDTGSGRSVAWFRPQFASLDASLDAWLASD